MESRVGRRALVDMMFLEDDRAVAFAAFNVALNTKIATATEEELKELKEKTKLVIDKIDEVGKARGITFNKDEELLTKAEKESFFTKVKNFFAKIYNWFKKIFKTGWEKIKSFFTWLYSLFFKEANLKSPRWLNIAIAVAVVIAIGYFLFGTEAGRKVTNFIVNTIKGGLGAIKSAIRYVLGKSNAPQEVKNETESFLDEATA
jgi:hypothetical protein